MNNLLTCINPFWSSPFKNICTDYNLKLSTIYNCSMFYPSHRQSVWISFTLKKSNHGRFKTRVFNFLFCHHWEHFNSSFHPSRLKTQFHDHLAARVMFNNSQLCSQAPSPQHEPSMQPRQPSQRPAQLSVCSVTLISSMSTLPVLTGYTTTTYAVVLIIKHGIVLEGVYSLSLA